MYLTFNTTVVYIPIYILVHTSLNSAVYNIQCCNEFCSEYKTMFFRFLGRLSLVCGMTTPGVD